MAVDNLGMNIRSIRRHAFSTQCHLAAVLLLRGSGGRDRGSGVWKRGSKAPPPFKISKDPEAPDSL